MTHPRILVTGATGKTGTVVALQLRQLDVPVRAIVRGRDARSERLDRAGVETVVSDSANAEEMRGALQGVARAYYLPPFHPSMLANAATFAAAATDAGLESIVGLSQWLASPDHPAWLTRQLWEMDQLFGSIPGLGYTCVKPPFFADNYLRLIGFAAHLGTLPSLTRDSRNAPPSTEDIAAVAVAALLDPARHAGHSYCPTGPEPLSTADMAGILARVLGRRVRTMEMPMWLFLKAARMQGVSDHELSGFRYWVEDHKMGAFEFCAPTDHVRQVTGRPPENFETIARRYAGLPEARRSLGATARAVADFMRTPLAPGYDLDRYERDHGLTPPNGARLALQDSNWRSKRAAETRPDQESLP